MKKDFKTPETKQQQKELVLHTLGNSDGSKGLNFDDSGFEGGIRDFRLILKDVRKLRWGVPLKGSRG